mgnify:CR=1 FL=1
MLLSNSPISPVGAIAIEAVAAEIVPLLFNVVIVPPVFTTIPYAPVPVATASIVPLFVKVVIEAEDPDLA